MDNKETVHENRLEIMKNEYRMLSNTLLEMIERGVDNERIGMIKRELGQKANEIKDYMCADREPSECKPQPIGVKQRPSKDSCNFYDSIAKPTDKECCESSDAKKYGDDYDAQIRKKNIETVENNFVNLDKKILAERRFLARLYEIGVMEPMVKEIHFSESKDNSLELVIYDYVNDSGQPILEKLENRRENGFLFNFNVEHLDPSGKCVYMEMFRGCEIVSIERSNLAYSSNEMSVIYVGVKYNKKLYGMPYASGDEKQRQEWTKTMLQKMY